MLLLTAFGTDTCPSEYTMYNNYCYYFSNEKENWNAAQKVCLSSGSNLSSITDLAEVKFVYKSGGR